MDISCIVWINFQMAYCWKTDKILKREAFMQYCVNF